MGLKRTISAIKAANKRMREAQAARPGHKGPGLAPKSKLKSAPKSAPKSVPRAPAATKPDSPMATALAKVPTATLSSAELHAHLQNSTQLAAQVSLLTVHDEDTCTQAATMLVQLKSAEKDLKAKRDLVVKPLKEHVALLDSLFKPGFERLEKADEALRTKVLAYRADAQKKADEAKAAMLAEAQQAADEGDNETALAKAVESENVATPTRLMRAVEGTSAPNVAHAQVATRMVTDFEVVDLGKVPHEYFTFDSSKVRAAIRSGVSSIPGIRVFERSVLAVGGR